MKKLTKRKKIIFGCLFGVVILSALLLYSSYLDYLNWQKEINDPTISQKDKSEMSKLILTTARIQNTDPVVSLYPKTQVEETQDLSILREHLSPYFTAHGIDDELKSYQTIYDSEIAGGKEEFIQTEPLHNFSPVEFIYDPAIKKNHKEARITAVRGKKNEQMSYQVLVTKSQGKWLIDESMYPVPADLTGIIVSHCFITC